MVETAHISSFAPMDILTIVMTVYAVIQVRRAWGQWKSLSIIQKNNVILPVLAAILFIIISLTV